MSDVLNLHCIYVADPSYKNFLTGLNENIWGFKGLNDNANQIKAGDYLLFAHALLGPVRSRFSGQLTQYVLAKVTSNIYTVNTTQDEDNPKIWDDEKGENIYPHRFNFKILSAYPSLKFKDSSYSLKAESFTVNEDPLVAKIYEAFRYSSCVQGRNGLISNISLRLKENEINDNSLKNLSNIFDLSSSILSRNSDKKVFDKFQPGKKSQTFEVNPDENIDNEISTIQQSSSLAETEKERLIQSRLGQGQFRRDILKNFKSTCLLTGIKHESLLLASHIKPWSESTNDERIDARNGLLLSALMDKLFDRYFITFEPKSLRLIMCNDPLIHDIIINHQLLDFVIKVPFRGKDLTIFKEYMHSHYSKFNQINEKRYG
ncbi:HNH endonuclease [Acinetobacter zhairhuonensis]|uniref:HNH endonuclease n=1 Tax=Acinetobacter sp. A7.4 TaxID=2919921 RepID=UPI001F4F3F2B|nr:HNH endonuclease [Acinetobacter sp. A7.4]MCJ8162317.1 HNH endonuclease [Acinetobacter sp. A7.4]